jgi:hypothetical protein
MSVVQESQSTSSVDGEKHDISQVEKVDSIIGPDPATTDESVPMTWKTWLVIFVSYPTPHWYILGGCNTDRSWP